MLVKILPLRLKYKNELFELFRSGEMSFIHTFFIQHKLSFNWNF